METKEKTAEVKFEEDRHSFEYMGGKVDELRPMLEDGGRDYLTDGQYILMGLWAFDRIRFTNPKDHVDVGGQIQFLSFLSRFIPVLTFDIRNPKIKMQNLEVAIGNILDLPIDDNSCESLSCLHVAEHIGLGRYGDEVDPGGFRKACTELKRVLAPGGTLYFAVPQGKPKTVFNAHRVLSSKQILGALDGLELVEFSAITSGGAFCENAKPEGLDLDTYGCGLYKLKKEVSK